MKSPLNKSIGEVVTDYGTKVMRILKKRLQRSLFDFYGDVKADNLRTRESVNVPITPVDGDGGVIYTKSSDGKLYYKSNEVPEVELSSSGATLTTEQVQDIVGAMFSGNTETNITATYEDSDGTIDLVSTDTNTQLTTEEVQDIVGAMFTSNTETRISATYEDSDGTIDLVVDAIPVDLTVDGAGTIHANNVPTLNQSTTGNAATATSLTTGDKAITGTLTVTDGSENIVLNSTASNGNPLLTFKQDSTRRAFIQLADNTAGFENHMRIASEYGPVSIAAASTAGSDTDTVYLMVEPTGVFKFGAADADAVLTTDGNMTFRIDSDNDETGQKFSFENNASTEIGSLDESGNLSVTGNVLPGITYVKILPSDFMPDDVGRPAMIDDTGSDRWLESHGTAKLFAYVDIPAGFKATHVDVYGSATSAVTVYEADVNSKTVTSKGTGNIGTQINITDVNSDATNYILIELAQASGEEVYGGKLTIAKI
tara:strand:- start:1575 stop:3026 length:1452 start_codon:yes stop_codon:yes gene_type:complete